MAKIKVTPRVGMRGLLSWDALRGNNTLTQRVGKERDTPEGVGDGRKVAKVLTHLIVGQDGSRGRIGTLDVWGKQVA